MSTSTDNLPELPTILPPSFVSGDALNNSIAELRAKKQVIFINASSIGKSACLYKFKKMVIDGCKPLGFRSAAIEFGNAVHRFIDSFRATGDYEKAIGVAQYYLLEHQSTEDDWRDNALLYKVCARYAEEYSNDRFVCYRTTDNEILTEQNFAIPFYECDRYVIMLAGTVDAIGRWDGTPCFSDVKTTAQWNKEQVMDSYKLSHQMLFYRYCLDLIGRSQGCPELINLSYFIDGIFLTKTGCTLMRSKELIMPTERVMNWFAEYLNRLIVNVRLNLDVTPSNWFRDGLVNGACNEAFGPCPYQKLCLAPDDVSEEFVLQTDFAQEDYNPLTFRD